MFVKAWSSPSSRFLSSYPRGLRRPLPKAFPSFPITPTISNQENLTEIRPFSYSSSNSVFGPKQPSASTWRQASTSSFLETEELPWLKGRVPNGFWNEGKNQQQFMKWLGTRLNFKSMDDWSAVQSLPLETFTSADLFLRYRITVKDFVSNHGRLLLESHFEGSPVKAVMTCFPGHTFLPWLFPKSPKGYFTLRENRLKYIDWLVKKVGAKSPSDLNWNHFVENNGTGLILAYGGSAQSVLASLSPNEEPISRKSRSLHHWESLENQKQCLDEIGLRIGASPSNLSPWYSLDQKTLLSNGLPHALLRKYGFSHATMLRTIYKDHSWGMWRFESPPRVIDSAVPSESISYSTLRDRSWRLQ